MTAWSKLRAESVAIAKGTVDYQRRVQAAAAQSTSARRHAENAAAEQGIEFRARTYQRRNKGEVGT